MKTYNSIPYMPEDVFITRRDVLGPSLIYIYSLRDHINRRACLQFDPPDVRTHLRYRSIPRFLLNQALVAGDCTYCHSAIAVRSNISITIIYILNSWAMRNKLKNKSFA